MTVVDTPKEVRSGEELDIPRLSEFLKKNIPGITGSVSVKQFPSGFSNLTYLVTAGDREFVLRRPPFGRKAKTAHDMSREYRILKALHPVFGYCPRPVLFCDDHSVLGCDFYVMERIVGVIPRKDFDDELALSASDARKLCENSIDVLCNLHAVDYNAVGLGDLGRPEGYVRRQVEGWSRRYRDAMTDDAPDFEDVMQWLADNMPEDTDRPCIIHNDFKFDNLVLEPGSPTKIIGLLDWEMATIGDPLMDLGSSLGYWVERDDPEEQQMIRMLPTTHDGMMTRREVVDCYLEKSGRHVDDFNFYYVFGTFRLAVIAQQIYYRYYHGQTRDERFGLLIAAVEVLERVALRAMERSQF
ncbi:MAG: phosphotransferase family protein [Desulfococcus sp. 4484_241]|nr:MAG: phosphotransferase family protein [Desulfococcus sp. 4484_241]